MAAISSLPLFTPVPPLDDDPDDPDDVPAVADAVAAEDGDDFTVDIAVAMEG